MTKKITSIVSMILCLVGFTAPVQTALADSGPSGDPGVLLITELAAGPAFPAADGKAKYKDRGGEQQLSVQVSVSAELAGTVLTVWVDGAVAGQATVDLFGHAVLRLNSDLGDIVPAVGAGTQVGVTTPAGATVVAGSF